MGRFPRRYLASFHWQQIPNVLFSAPYDYSNYTPGSTSHLLFASRKFELSEFRKKKIEKKYQLRY